MFEINNRNFYTSLVYASIGYLFVAILSIYSANIHAQVTSPQSITYKGHYTCNQGKTDLILTLDENLKTAVFDFNYNGIAKGSFNMEVELNDGGMILRGKDWIKRPNNYRTVDLKGTFDSNFKYYNGQVLTKGCSNFNLVLQGTNEARELLKARIPVKAKTPAKAKITASSYLGNLERSMLDVFHPYVFYDESKMHDKIQEPFILYVASGSFKCMQKLAEGDKLDSASKRDLEGDINLIISECGSNALPSYDKMLSDLEMEETKELSREYYLLKDNIIKYCPESIRISNEILKRGYARGLINKYNDNKRKCIASRMDYSEFKINFIINYNYAKTSSLKRLLDNDNKELKKFDLIFENHDKICNFKDVDCDN